MAGRYERTAIKTIRVRKERLLETLRSNLDEHRGAYEDAMRGYRAAMIAELGGMLAQAEAGEDVDHEIDLERPEDHSESYEQALLLMEWDVEDEIELSVSDFECYVRNNWGWTYSFRSTHDRYTA